MTILKDGQVPDPIILRFECPICGCIFELPETEVKRKCPACYSLRHAADMVLHEKCPTCGERVNCFNHWTDISLRNEYEMQYCEARMTSEDVELSRMCQEIFKTNLAEGIKTLDFSDIKQICELAEANAAFKALMDKALTIKGRYK